MIYSQTLCKVNYIVLPTGGTFENNEDIKKFKTAKYFIGFDEALKKVNYELVVKNNESFYSQIPSLDLDNSRIDKTAKNLAGSSSFYKKNLEIIKIAYLSGETFNVLLNKSNEWKVTNESKIINDYLCFKATREKIANKKVSVQVIAWFCPKIPINDGPKEFCDLPGLILELQDGRFTYLASNIDLSKTQKNVIPTPKGEVISENQYDKILAESKDKMFSNMR